MLPSRCLQLFDRLCAASSAQPPPAAGMFAKLRSSLLPSTKPASADNNDCRKQNRLSKPPTNASSLNLSTLSLLQLDNRHSTVLPSSTSTEDLQDHCPFSPNDEPRELLKARLFGPDAETSQASPQLETKSWKEAHLVGSGIETQHSTCALPRSPIASPLSAIFDTSRLSLVSNGECKDAREKISPKTEDRSGNPSREELTSPIPIRRKSLRQPGIATRIQKDERWGPSPPCTAGVDPDRDYYYNPVFPEEEASHIELEALNLETPTSCRPVPPPLVRTETPSELVFLGGLKLGSLHVTNGRASPAPSDLSRRAKARSTPNLRAASSEYGDSDHEDGDTDVRAMARDGSPKRPNIPEVPSRFTPRGPRCQRPLRISSDDSVPKIDAADERVGKSSQVHKRAEDAHPAERSPDKRSLMAVEHMAELSAGPFAVARCSSASGSVVQTTTKSTEIDDNLFDEESVGLSDSESNDNSTLDTLYSSNDVTVAQDKQESLPQKSRPACTLADSGYSSNTSLRATRETIHDEHTVEQTESANTHHTTRNTPQNELTMPKKRQDRRPGPRPLRPSILKQAGATTTSLPIFDNLRHSTATIATIMTTVSTSPTPKPNKLAKLRRSSRSAHSKEIAIPGNHEIFTSFIPPVPAEIAANLAIRSQQVPELEHTFESRQHTAESPTKSHFDPVEIRFPSPTASIHGTDGGSPTALGPPAHRGSPFRRRSKSERRRSVYTSSNELSEADALAMIQDFGTVGHALGGNPYDIARTNLESTSGRNVGATPKINPRHISYAAKRPKSVGGMDAETAAELARTRSRTIYERDSTSVAEKRNLFNDRGGVPGKNLRPANLATDTPPLPALPASFDAIRRQTWAPETTHRAMQQPHSWSDNHQPVYNKNSYSQPPAGQSIYNHWEVLTSNRDHNVENPGEEYLPNDSQIGNERRQSWRSDRVQIDFDQTELDARPRSEGF